MGTHGHDDAALAGFPYDNVPRIDFSAPCAWCGKTFEQHRVTADLSVAPRVPCGGLRSGFVAKRADRTAQVLEIDQSGKVHAVPYDIENIYRYHAPKGDQAATYERLRGVAKTLAQAIVESCPDSRERAVALTHLETCVMWANASIARS